MINDNNNNNNNNNNDIFSNRKSEDAETVPEKLVPELLMQKLTNSVLNLQKKTQKNVMKLEISVKRNR